MWYDPGRRLPIIGGWASPLRRGLTSGKGVQLHARPIARASVCAENSKNTKHRCTNVHSQQRRLFRSPLFALLLPPPQGESRGEGDSSDVITPSAVALACAAASVRRGLSPTPTPPPLPKSTGRHGSPPLRPWACHRCSACPRGAVARAEARGSGIRITPLWARLGWKACPRSRRHGVRPASRIGAALPWERPHRLKSPTRTRSS